MCCILNIWDFYFELWKLYFWSLELSRLSLSCIMPIFIIMLCNFHQLLDLSSYPIIRNTKYTIIHKGEDSQSSALLINFSMPKFKSIFIFLLRFADKGGTQGRVSPQAREHPFSAAAGRWASAASDKEAILLCSPHDCCGRLSSLSDKQPLRQKYKWAAVHTALAATAFAMVSASHQVWVQIWIIFLSLLPITPMTKKIEKLKSLFQ